MKRYRVLSGFCIRSGQDVYPGDEVSFEKGEEALEKQSVLLGRVQEIEGGAAEVAAPEGDEPEGDDPGGETGTERRRRRG